MSTLNVRQLSRGIDVGLLTAAVLLTIFGLGALFSFSLNIAQPNFSLLTKQFIYLLVGLVFIFLLARFDYRFLGGIHWLLYALSLLSLIAVLFFGQTVRGTTGWFEFAGFQLQPVEFTKVVLAIVLAKYFSDQADRLTAWSTTIVSGLITAVPVALVMRQPDLGSATILIGTWFGLLMILPVPRRRIILITFCAILLAIVSWFILLQPYQKARITNVILPGRDPLRSGYNVHQAITAIGSGQIFGRGLGLGPQSQLNFLPERQTDFIFASICEELGLIGGALVIFLYCFYCWRCYALARRSQDIFSIVLIMGLTWIVSIQAVINIGMNLGVLPVTGITLPFISYGGSSLIASLIAVGILESISARQRILPL